MRRMTTVLVLSVVAIPFSGCDRYTLDRQMEKLCKNDGGVKVYETVTLPPAEYDKLFKYVITAKAQEDYYGPEYRHVSIRKHLVGNENSAERGRGELIHIYSALYRRSDNRLLGESVWYARGGGDLFTFGFQPSSNSCPRPRYDLAQSVFIKGE